MLATGHTELEWIKIGKEKLIKIKSLVFLDPRLTEDNQESFDRPIWTTESILDHSTRKLHRIAYISKQNLMMQSFFMTSKVNFIKKSNTKNSVDEKFERKCRDSKR